MLERHSASRPQIAFIDYLDVFEDFYPHYGIDQDAFATHWDNSANHQRLALLQREIGDVTWYTFAIRPQFQSAVHARLGCQVRMFHSSWLHRRLWRMYYYSKWAWDWKQRNYRTFATIASYLAPLSLSFLRAIRRDRPRFLVVQDYASGRFDVMVFVARWLRIPLIAVHTGGQPDGYLAGGVRKRTLRHASHIVASSQRELEMLHHRFRVPRERLSVLLTPMDSCRFAPRERSSACRFVGLDDKRRYVLFVGRLDPIKRLSAIIENFARLKDRHLDVDLVILGDGPERQGLVEQATRSCPNRIQFRGWVGDVESKACYYNAAECLVLASVREGFPAVLGEAMLCGTPVLSTDVGAIRELVVPEETGWLVPALDDDAWTNALERILVERTSTEATGARARKVAELRLSPAVVAAGWRDCIRKAEEVDE